MVVLEKTQDELNDITDEVMSEINGRHFEIVEAYMEPIQDRMVFYVTTEDPNNLEVGDVFFDEDPVTQYEEEQVMDGDEYNCAYEDVLMEVREFMGSEFAEVLGWEYELY